MDSHSIYVFPVNIPLNQSIETSIVKWLHQDLSRRLLDSFRDGGGLGPLSRPSRSPTLAPAPAPLAADPAIAAVYQHHQEPPGLSKTLADLKKRLSWTNVGKIRKQYYNNAVISTCGVAKFNL